MNTEKLHFAAIHEKADGNSHFWVKIDSTRGIPEDFPAPRNIRSSDGQYVFELEVDAVLDWLIAAQAAEGKIH